LGNCHTVFPSSSTILHFHQLCTRTTVVLHLHQHLLFSALFFIVASQPTGFKVIFLCGLDLHFSNDYWYRASFYVLLGYLSPSIHILCPFLNWVIFLTHCWVVVFYILGIDLFSDVWFT
jgi:hypothetical protein